MNTKIKSLALILALTTAATAQPASLSLLCKNPMPLLKNGAFIGLGLAAGMQLVTPKFLNSMTTNHGPLRVAGALFGAGLVISYLYKQYVQNKYTFSFEGSSASTTSNTLEATYQNIVKTKFDEVKSLITGSTTDTTTLQKIQKIFDKPKLGLGNSTKVANVDRSIVTTGNNNYLSMTGSSSNASGSVIMSNGKGNRIVVDGNNASVCINNSNGTFSINGHSHDEYIADILQYTDDYSKNLLCYALESGSSEISAYIITLHEQHNI